MTRRKPAKLTRRLMPHIHKPNHHGTKSWTTWMPASRIATTDSFRHGPRRKDLC